MMVSEAYLSIFVQIRRCTLDAAQCGTNTVGKRFVLLFFLFWPPPYFPKRHVVLSKTPQGDLMVRASEPK